MTADPVPTRALVIAAHPDDADYGCGGLLAGWARNGCEITVACVTDGGSGGFDDEMERAQVPVLRRQEQQAAADALGVRHVVFLGRLDGFVTVDADLRRDLARVVRQVRPEVVVTHSPERNYRFYYLYHTDHLATGAAALTAVYPDARNAFAFPELRSDEGLEPWEVPQVWLFGDPAPDRAVDVTDDFDAKVAACNAHSSQTPMLDGSVADVLRGSLAETAREQGMPTGRLAEVYRVLLTA